MARPAHIRARRFLFLLAVTGVVPFLAGCPKKETPIVDAGPPPPPPTETVTNLVAMDDDAGAPDADADAPAKHYGPAVNPNVAHLLQCCNALGAQAKQNANSPEGAMVLQVANQCTAAAKNIGPAGTAPEFATIRQMLAGHTIPAACQGM
jgi:hypothetical protein